MSSAEQVKGDSLRRQLERSRLYAEKHGLALDESLQDLGVSAYRGTNRIKGALFGFLKLVRAGRVPRGSYLLIENLDRLSRENAYDAMKGPFSDLIDAGTPAEQCRTVTSSFCSAITCQNCDEPQD
jgi:DNA invertase Pin-like site-specific DNA recombinase